MSISSSISGPDEFGDESVYFSDSFHRPRESEMTLGSLRVVILCSMLVVASAGCADAIQDKGEIPATIGLVKDVQQEDGKEAILPETTTNQKPGATSELESAETEPLDLATILRKEKEEFVKQTIEIPGDWKRMWKESHIWANIKKKQVIVRGAICSEKALLEMFACPRKTKEHEAVVSVHGKASEVHATMLAMKINPGAPMIFFQGEYYPVDGPILNIEVWWNDENGKLVKRRAQELIRNTDTGKAMESEFVFGGSEQVYDPYEKKQDYMADFGPMINVANQPDAMIDVSIESSEAAQGSLFQAFTENLPPINTKVYLVISATGKKIERKKGKPSLKAVRAADEKRRAARIAEMEAERAAAEKARLAAEKAQAEADKKK